MKYIKFSVLALCAVLLISVVTVGCKGKTDDQSSSDSTASGGETVSDPNNDDYNNLFSSLTDTSSDGTVSKQPSNSGGSGEKDASSESVSSLDKTSSVTSSGASSDSLTVVSDTASDYGDIH